MAPGVKKKAKQKSNKVGAFLGVAIDKELNAAIPDMNQEQLEQQLKTNSLRTGTAAAGFALNTIGLVFYPAYAFGATLNWRQLVVAWRTTKIIEQAMQTKLQQASGADQASQVGHVKGTYRYFLAGAGMKAVIFVAFLGHVGAEDFVISCLNPADLAASLPPDVVASLPVEEMAEDLQRIARQVFAIPHAFNDNIVVHSVQAVADLPKEAVLGAGQSLPSWDQMYSFEKLTEQLVVGAAMEANVPGTFGEKATETVAEVWSKSKEKSK